MSIPYRHVRFRWWTRVDLDKVADEFKGKYSVDMTHYPRDSRELSIFKDDREELVVTADTLIAHLSSFRAVLSQKKAAKFTSKDVELRRQVREIYTHDRPTPFPWEFIAETKYEVQT